MFEIVFLDEGAVFDEEEQCERARNEAVTAPAPPPVNKQG